MCDAFLILAQTGAGGNALEKLKIFIDNHMDLLEREAGLVEVIQVELRQSSKFLKDYTPVKFFEYLEVISGILEEGMREGSIRPDLNVSVARRAIFGVLDSCPHLSFPGSHTIRPSHPPNRRLRSRDRACGGAGGLRNACEPSPEQEALRDMA
jgi:hypothetical protein